VVLRLVNIHRRPARALLADGFRAVADFFQFAAFVQLVDIASCRRRRNPSREITCSTVTNPVCASKSSKI
jgi:hypothetical protein